MALSATCLWAALADVKPWLRLTVSDVEHDVLLEMLANSVTEELERETGRVFVSRAITERFDSLDWRRVDGQQARRFTLRGYPVSTNPLTTFTIDGTAVDADDYALDTEGGVVRLLRLPLTSASGISDVVVTYTAGYARASLPATVLQLGIEMLAFRYSDWSAGANAVQSMRMGGSEYIPRSSWPYHIKDAIAALRYEFRVVVA